MVTQLCPAGYRVWQKRYRANNLLVLLSGLTSILHPFNIHQHPLSPSWHQCQILGPSILSVFLWQSAFNWSVWTEICRVSSTWAEVELKVWSLLMMSCWVWEDKSCILQQKVQSSKTNKVSKLEKVVGLTIDSFVHFPTDWGYSWRSMPRLVALTLRINWTTPK